MALRLRVAALVVGATAAGPACQETTPVETAPLAIQCSANPTAGPAPLTVAFGLDIQNASGALGIAIAYGDGSQGTDPAARHVYAEPGDYMASFTVTAGSETARCSTPVSVTRPAEPSPSPLPANRPPLPDFGTNPPATGASITGKAPFLVAFNLCRSVDPDGDRLLYRMDLDGDSAFEFRGSSGADCRHEATYAAGVRTATLCVADVDCPSWPLCEDYPPLHGFQCRSYSVTATP